MKKRFTIIIMAVMLMVSTVLTAGCGANEKVTVEYGPSVSLELISADDGLGEVSVDDNKVIFHPSEKGEFNIKVKSNEGKEIAINVVLDEDGCTVSDDSGLSFKAISD